MEEIRTLPQIISAFDSASLARVRELFSIINDDLIELSPLEQSWPSCSRIAGAI